MKKSLLNSYFESVSYPDVFQTCTGIDILKRTDHPPWICNKCDKQLIHFYSFRKNCIEADETLNSNIENEDPEMEEANLESNNINIKLELNDTYIKSESEDCPVLVNEEDIPMAVDDFDDTSDQSYIKSESEESDSESIEEIKTSQRKNNKPSTEISTVVDESLLNPQIKCDLCDVKCTNETTLKVHKNIMHLNDCPTFACLICNSTFYTENLLDNHKKSHSGIQNQKCRYCERLFNSTGARENHERRHHTGVKPYKCLDCEDRSFFSKSEYNRHTKRMHSKERPFICKLCNKSFTINQDLRQHMRNIHENIRNFQCDICGHGSLTVTNLRYHKKIVHESTAQHPCDLCSETFNKKPLLWKHKRTKHRGANICDICGVSLMTSTYLKTHRLSHDESNKKFSCPVCPTKSFVKNAALRRHIKDSHPNIEPPPPLERHPNPKGRRREIINPGLRTRPNNLNPK